MFETKAGWQPWLGYGTLFPYAGCLVFAKSRKSLGWQDRLTLFEQKARSAEIRLLLLYIEVETLRKRKMARSSLRAVSVSYGCYPALCKHFFHCLDHQTGHHSIKVEKILSNPRISTCCLAPSDLIVLSLVMERWLQNLG